MTYFWQQFGSTTPFGFRDGMGTCVLNGEMFVLGGWKTDGSRYNDVYRSSNGINFTKSGTPASWSPRHSFACCVHNGRIFVIGGDFLGTSYQADIHSWSGVEGDPWVQEFTNVAMLNRVGHWAVSFAGKLLVGGGHTFPPLSPTPTVFFTDVWASNTGRAGDTFSLVTDKAPTGTRGYICGAPPVVGGKAYFIGSGCYNTPDFPNREYKGDVFALNSDLSISFVSARKLPGLMYHAVGSLGSDLVVAGGRTDINPGNDAQQHWVSTDFGVSWSSPPTPWAARHAANLTEFKSSLFMVGGAYTNDIWRMAERQPLSTIYGAVPDSVTNLGATYTVIDRTNALTPGAKVSSLGIYFNGAHGSVRPKIARENSPTNYDIVFNGAPASHPGGGWAQFIGGGYTVPNDGKAYRVAFAFANSNGPDAYSNSAPNGRAMCAGDVSGSGLTFSNPMDGSFPMSWTPGS